MFNKSIAAIVTFTAVSAQAQPEVDMTNNETPKPDAAPAPVAAATPAGPFQKGTLGFSFSITLLQNIAKSVSLTAEGIPTVDVLYFLDDKTAIDIVGGINIHKKIVYDNSTPPVGMSTTIFGFAIGAGYRMYKHRNERLHTFLEPALTFNWDNTSDSSTIKLQALGELGAEAMFTDWASLSGWIGLGFAVANKFEDIQFATQVNLAANLYWR